MRQPYQAAVVLQDAFGVCSSLATLFAPGRDCPGSDAVCAQLVQVGEVSMK